MLLGVMRVRPGALVVVMLLCASAPLLCAARLNLTVDCPGNLLVNGGFELPDTTKTPTELLDPTSNSKWGWYKKIPGWYTTRPDGRPCVRVDWQKPYIEVSQGALATPMEGIQYGELLPNGTGNYCQDIKVVKGATYTLSYYYGRLMTYSQTTNGSFHEFDTAIDVAVRPGNFTPAKGGIWPADQQGYTVISSADTKQGWDTYQKQWVQYNTTFTAPADTVTLAFINTKRPKECGSCGSLVDAICLTKAS